MPDNLTIEQALLDMANAIRTKEESTLPIQVRDYANRIMHIETGEGGVTMPYQMQNVNEQDVNFTIFSNSFTNNKWYFYNGSSYITVNEIEHIDISTLPINKFYVNFSLNNNLITVSLIVSGELTLTDFKINNVSCTLVNGKYLDMIYTIESNSLTNLSLTFIGKTYSFGLTESLVIPNTDTVNVALADILGSNELQNSEQLNYILDLLMGEEEE